jgi:polar amino acid transport system substrate-binding protein
LALVISLINADELKEQMSKLKILAEDNYPPITFRNSGGKPDGLAVEVTNEILKRLHLNKRIYMLPWSRAYNMLLKRENIVLFSVSRTKQRDKLFQWVGPIYSMKSSFYVKKGSNITISSLDDAKKLKKIGTYRDSFNEQYLKKLGFHNLEAVTNNVLNIKKLMSGRIDAIVDTNVTIKELLHKAGYSMKDVEKVYTFLNVGVYYAFSKDVPFEVIEKWRDAFEQLRSNCELQKIRNKWLK